MGHAQFTQFQWQWQWHGGFGWPLVLGGVWNAVLAPSRAPLRPAPSRVSLGRPVAKFWAPVDAGNVARAGVAEHAKTLDPA